nr:MAG TPA: hypothetical protein [Caudoviricetes sp.]DAH17158.1 MAG TPA: hypothetical protein [Bacteriophage sp.]
MKILSYLCTIKNGIYGTINFSTYEDGRISCG